MGTSKLLLGARTHTHTHTHKHTPVQTHALVSAALGRPLTKTTCLLSDPMSASRPQWPASRVTFCGLACPVAAVSGWRSRLSGFKRKHNQRETRTQNTVKGERDREQETDRRCWWQHKSQTENHICDWKLPKDEGRVLVHCCIISHETFVLSFLLRLSWWEWRFRCLMQNWLSVEWWILWATAESAGDLYCTSWQKVLLAFLRKKAENQWTDGARATPEPAPTPQPQIPIDGCRRLPKGHQEVYRSCSHLSLIGWCWKNLGVCRRIVWDGDARGAFIQ